LWLIFIAFIAVVMGVGVRYRHYLTRSHVKAILRPVEDGKPIDEFNGVQVFYNGHTGNTHGRTIRNGYNIGLKYQCVEFVKRYYYEHLGHKMPNPYGHARDFFDTSLRDGQFNKQRNLYQYTNPGFSKPMVNDIVVFKPTRGNPYGHVAIVSQVNRRSMEIIHQNAGPGRPSRLKYDLKYENGKWHMISPRAMGWLRKEML
jgi:surface antigen